MLNLNAFVVIFLAIASFMIGSSSNDLTEQVAIAQNKTEDNNTDEDNTNESGTISNLPTPIRPPFA
jgi:hypothetical protein